MTERKRTPASDRVWNKVNKLPGDGCWVWTASKNRWGYGQIIDWREDGSKKLLLAHRLIYSLVIGSPPDGMDLDHLCRNRACVRPDHLEPVSRWENLRRGSGTAGRRDRSEACSNGHRWEDGNEYINPNTNVRQCRTCRREGARRSRDHTRELMGRDPS